MTPAVPFLDPPPVEVDPPLVVLAASRTGTTLLRWILSEDPSLVDCSEPFNPDLDEHYPTFWKFLQTEWQPSEIWPLAQHAVGSEERTDQFARYLRHLDQLYPGQQKILDFKYSDVGAAGTFHHSPDAAPVVLAALLARGAPVVHLSRINPLDKHCSQLLAYARQTWVQPKKRDETPSAPAARGHRIRVPVEGLPDVLRRIDENVRIGELWLGGYDRVLRLKYEHLLVGETLAPDIRSDLEKLIGRPLQISGRPATVKQAPPLAELVENLAEVREALAGTEYAWCAEEIGIEERSPWRARRAAAIVDAGRDAGAAGRMVCVVAAKRAGGHLLRSTVAAAMSATDLDEPFNPTLPSTISGSFDEFVRRAGPSSRRPLTGGPAAPALLPQYFDELAEGLGGGVGVIGVRYESLRAFDWSPMPPDALPNLLHVIVERGHPVVHVSRRDMVAQYASLVLAEQSGVWVARAGSRQAAPQPVRIEVAPLLRYLETQARQRAVVEAWLSTVPRCAHLFYEDLVQGIRLDRKAAQALRAIGIQVADGVYLTGRKIAPPLREFVTNLDEVLAGLAETPFASLAALPRAAQAVNGRGTNHQSVQVFVG